jgi:hypothetical protein
MATLWIDATDMKKWKGPKSGISRVLACVTHELLSLDGVASKLCVFDESTATFRPFEAAEALYPEPPPSGATDGGIRRRLTTRIKTVVSSFDRKLPHEIKNPLRLIESDAYHLLVDSGRLALSVGRWLLPRRESPASASSAGAPYGVVRFSDDDVLLALSSTWEYRDYTEVVAKLKDRSALKFVHLPHSIEVPSLLPGRLWGRVSALGRRRSSHRRSPLGNLGELQEGPRASFKADRGPLSSYRCDPSRR